MFRKKGREDASKGQTMGDFFMVLKDMGLVSTTLSVAKLTHIFFISNFEEDQETGWDDWEWEMSFDEFGEAIVRIAVLSAHPKAEDLDKLFSSAVPENVIDCLNKFMEGRATMRDA